MKRFDMIQFIESQDPDSISMMYPVEQGKFVLAHDADTQIKGLVHALKQLRNCNINFSSSKEINGFIDNIVNSVEKVQ